MALRSLEKKEKLILEKEDTGEQLTKVRIGLRWEMKPGLEADLDASVVLLGKNMKMWQDDSVVCYATEKTNGKILSDDGAIEHMGDERGDHVGEGDGDDEEIEMDLTRVTSGIQHILVTITSYVKKGQDPVRFGRVKNATVRLYNLSGGEAETICEFDLSEDMGTWTSMEMGIFAREGRGWAFTALGVGVGSSRSGLEDVIAKYS